MPPRKTRPAQLDREIAEALQRRPRTASRTTPWLGSSGASKRVPSSVGKARSAPKESRAAPKVKARAHAVRRGKGNGKQAEVLMVANDAALSQQFDRAEEILGQGKQRAVATACKTVTPESSAEGDFADQGWEDEDGDPIEVSAYDFEEALEVGSHAPVTDAIVKQAVRWLRDHGASEPSSSSYHPGVWYSSEFEVSDYGTGEERSEDFFLRNFTPQEEKLVFDEFHEGRRRR